MDMTYLVSQFCAVNIVDLLLALMNCDDSALGQIALPDTLCIATSPVQYPCMRSVLGTSIGVV